jgi:serine/threonine protein kinase
VTPAVETTVVTPAFVVYVAHSQLQIDVAIELFLQLACGVNHMHACGVLHRDLKTDNALVSSTAPLVVKWADFGCAVKLRDSDSTYGSGTCTDWGSLCGLTV